MRRGGWAERPFGPRGLAIAIVLAVVLFALAFAGEVAIRPGDYIKHSDVPLYSRYGSEVVGGAVPYRDFYFEYPPGALPLFVLPATRPIALGSTSAASWAPVNASGRRYHRGFERCVFALGVLIVVLSGLSLAALLRPGRTVAFSLAIVASMPLLLGDVYPERFDVWPTAITAAAIAACLHGRYKLGGAALGVAAASKVYPLLLLPVLIIVVARHRRPREAALVAAIAVGVAVSIFLPFAIMAFSATWEALRIQFEGGLQIESLGSAALVLASHASRRIAALGLPGPFRVTDQPAAHGLSRGVLVGSGTAATATVLNVLVILALLWLWTRLLRSKADPREDLVRYAAATVVIAVALGSVLSPQYVIWLIPLVPLVAGRRGTAATVTVAIAAVLTHVWFPGWYFKYAAGLHVGPTMLLFARDLALLSTGILLAVPRWSPPRGARRPHPQDR